MDPGEMRNLAGAPTYAELQSGLEERLNAWMRQTADPLLDGPVPPPSGALVNDPAGVSADEPFVGPVD